MHVIQGHSINKIGYNVILIDFDILNLNYIFSILEKWNVAQGRLLTSTVNISSTCIRVSVPQLISKSVPYVRICTAAADTAASLFAPDPQRIRSASSLQPTRVP